MPRKRKSSIDGNLPLLRQCALERFQTTDQHAMAIVGLTKTKQGDTRFICKNSWGEQWGMKGYCLMSKEDFLINTILVGVVDLKR
jgi:bleomycin hydrolase